MPIWTLVSGVRSSCDAAAMNSDFSRLISRRWVMSSSSMTAPTSVPSASRIGVVRMRNARRAPSTPSGTNGRALSGSAGAAGLEHVEDRHARVGGSRTTSAIGRLTIAASGPNSRSAAALIRCDAPVSVGDDHRVVERVDGRLGRLLRDEQLAQVRAPQLADSPAMWLKPSAERPDLVGRGDVDAGFEVAGRHPLRRVGQLPDGADDGVREHDRARARRPARARAPSPASSTATDGRAWRRCVRLPAHRVLIDAQQPIALPAQIAEQRFLCAEVLVRELPGAAGRERSGRTDLENSDRRRGSSCPGRSRSRR